MAENGPLSRTRLAQVVLLACRSDQVPLLSHCISMSQHDDSKVTLQQALREGLKRSARQAAMKCLSYVLEHGADVRLLSPQYLVSMDSISASIRKVLEILLAHGYDINSEGPGGTVLEYIGFDDHELVKWCIDKGANANPSNHTPPGQRSQRKPVLERAAITGNIDTFELLRSKGAPLDRGFGAFPEAVMMANDLSSDTAGLSPRFKQQMDMITHLLDVVKCDVNSKFYGPYYASGSLCSTPLCWIACHPRGSNVKELIWLLLGHGGDLDLSFECTDSHNKVTLFQSAHQSAKEIPRTKQSNQMFLKAVREWEARQPFEGA